MKKALLFINGQKPKSFPETDFYDIIACTDGAFYYLESMSFPMDELDFISGDFDSMKENDDPVFVEKLIHTPDQNKTDFYKALEILESRGCTIVDVYGASGDEQDHFLGNLNAAYLFKDKMEITFYDDFSSYYFIPKKFTLNNIEGKMISIIPFPSAHNIITKGLKWSLTNEDLGLTTRLGTRNVAENNTVSIQYSEGDILLFVEN